MAIHRNQNDFVSLCEDLLAVVDLDGCFVEVNAHWAIQTGWHPSELEGQSLAQFIHVYDSDLTYFEFTNAKNNLTQTKYESQFKAKDGSYRQLLWKIKFHPEQLVFIVWAQDLTQTRLTEKSLRLEKERLEESQEIAHFGSWEFDLATGKIHWSRELYKIHDLEELTEPPPYEALLDRFSPSSRKLLAEAVQKAIEFGIPYRLNVEVLTRNSGIRYGVALGLPIQGPDGFVEKLHGTVLDVTEQHLAVQHMHQSNEQIEEQRRFLDTILNALPIKIALVDRNLIYQYSNITSKSEIHTSTGSAIGKHVSEILGVGNFTSIEPDIKRALAGETVIEERDIQDPSGQTKTVLLTLIPQWSASRDQVLGFYSIMQDISEQKLAERAALEQRNILRAILDNIPSAIILKDIEQDFKIIEWNQSSESLLSRPAKEVLGKRTHDLYPQSIANELNLLDQTAVRHGHLTEEQSPLIPVPGKGLRYFRTRKIPILPDSTGKFRFLLNVLDDLTDQMKSQQDLIDLHNVMDETMIVIETGIDGVITQINRNFSKVSGYSKEDTLGQNHRTFNSKYHDSLFFADLWRTITAGRIWQGEIRNQRKDGSLYWLYTTIAPGRDFSGKINKYVSFCVDITSEKEAQHKLIQSSKMSSLGEMAGGIAHEINNPLAIISGKAQQLLRSIEHDKFHKEQFLLDLKKIESTVDRIARIIRGLRSFSRNSDSDPMERVPVSRIVDDSLELCKERFKHGSIELSVHCMTDAAVDCRPAQISQVILNLLSNAFDAVSVLPMKWVDLHVETIQGQVQIKVTDSGDGISPDVLNKIMQPFYTTKDPGKGTGLGLSISKGIAEEHQGELRYDSDSKNTRFVLVLPVAIQPHRNQVA